MKLLKKKSKYSVDGYLLYKSTVIKDLTVSTYNNGKNFAISLGTTEIDVSKEQAKEIERLLSQALTVFDTTYYNFD